MPWLGLWWLCTCGAWEWKSHAALLTTEVGLLVLGEVVKPSLVLGQHCFMAADGSSCVFIGQNGLWLRIGHNGQGLLYLRCCWDLNGDFGLWLFFSFKRTPGVF
jgi:hypothetical protein